ncbi:bifunctional Ribosomal protein L7A-L8/Ribosomal protein L7Ae-L30e-S12e-Gadd45/Ribosomal protein L7Ae conserved site/Ribosomal protein L7Ae-L8-Nhp2 family/50S ribosomal protein L30e-like [Babesia duncani]|uniref:60S ribosomal protein L7a n=1 Tax=Babesia duncani TaxID=323732 RepID=A0AAD9PJ24_9APIC|nr:bifunctional Ribosomal protein L7A-L8/Ribosomal protein L7Ae-L30e-S12e-Gadd45/Ribosomal protein L7Ae conserved site/Ribosomal protein L7Ae-L8-Nhp2 family/50S ribosomal protein L30e-like [Babesia duncani]
MLNVLRKGKKGPAPAPLSKQTKEQKVKEPHFESTKKNLRIGGAIRPRVNLSRYVKWPRYIKIQRQRRVLLQRLKIPPAINQFNYTIDKSQALQLLRLLNKYKPETKKEKAARLLKDAEVLANGGELPATKKPFMLKSGLNHVTNLVEYKKAKLVVIAHDVDPLELVLWLPALCRKKEVPYCIIKGKARLGKLVHKKTASVVAIESVRKEDQAEFDNMVKNFVAMFNDNVELRRKWGGHIMGIKSQHVQAKKEALIAIENAKKLGLAYG